jgi:DNA-binding CsgD family transcriptional regulator
MIPAGLADKNIEFFSRDGELYSIQDGHRYTYPDMPQEHLLFLWKQITDDETGRATVAHLRKEDRVKTYSICRFGGCNSTPDSSEDLNLMDPAEYFDCGLRGGKCPWEGKRCKEILAERGVISTRQLEIMKLVAAGLFNKEIADRLQISENTVANHLANIFDKLGDRSRVVITSFVKERGIL